MNERLAPYAAKRDFAATPEPPAAAPNAAEPERGARFVVQQHSARRLHWDLRLERDGALASWALPRGVPDDPRHNRKAVRTEDHPLQYLDFAGEIPAGNYGAGTMSIWDHGHYVAEKWREDEVIATFHGTRLQGRYALFRTGAGKDWLMHRMDAPLDADREPMPRGLSPMLARAGELPDDELRWSYEIKWDGVRAIAYCSPGEIHLESRNMRDITPAYPELRAIARELGSRDAVLDGEIVVLDGEGKPSFAALQGRMHVRSDSAARGRARDTPATYMIFDLLYLDGRSLLDVPYAQRREALTELALSGPAWQTPAAHQGDGRALLEATAAQGLEGLVAKRLDAPYEPGRRGGAWIKVRNSRRQELVIGGWLVGEGRRREQVGALLVGYHEAGGELAYAGRVGSGFSDAMLVALSRALAPLARESSPFARSAELPRGARFVEPELVAEVQFTQWTPGGRLRQPTFKGLRDDIPAGDVVREDADVADERDAERDATVAVAAAHPRQRRESRGGRRSGPAERGPFSLFDDVQVSGEGYEVTLEGRRLRLTNYDKVLFAASGFTKGDLIEYYARVAPAMLVHLRDRPLTLKRYPNGVDAAFFYEKNCPAHRPDWVQTVSVAGSRRGGGAQRATSIDYCLVQDAPTLVWAANLAAIELHASLARAPALDVAREVVFDLDPGEPAGLHECCEVALVLEGLFSNLSLRSFVKTSGSKGLQVYVPLGDGASFHDTKSFARQVAELLAAQAPALVVSRMTRSLRGGRVLVDWSQNDRHKTTVAVYSVRAREHPTVSAPVSWDEVRAAHDGGDAGALRLDSADVLARIDAGGDLFAQLAGCSQRLPQL